MAPNKPKAGTRLHPIRLDDELWSAATAKAEAEGTTVSAEVRRFLERWISETTHGQDLS